MTLTRSFRGVNGQFRGRFEQETCQRAIFSQSLAAHSGRKRGLAILSCHWTQLSAVFTIGDGK